MSGRKLCIARYHGASEITHHIFLNTTLVSKHVFAYPTESFFALGVKATDTKAIQQLFRLKKREAGKPIALIAADLRQVKKFFFMLKAEEQLAKQYWPGALTMLLKPKRLLAVTALVPSSPNLSSIGRRGTLIGVRVPAHAGARKLAQAVGAPITATSANISGQPPTKSARKIKKLFPDILIVPGRCGKARRPSAIIEVINNKIIIHRQGPRNLSPMGARIPGS